MRLRVSVFQRLVMRRQPSLSATASAWVVSLFEYNKSSDEPITWQGASPCAAPFGMSLAPGGQRLRVRRYPRACRLARVVWPAAPYHKFCADPPADHNQTNGDYGGDQDDFQLDGHAGSVSCFPINIWERGRGATPCVNWLLHSD